MSDNIGFTFFRETSYSRGALPRHGLDWTTKPPTFKTYPDAQRVKMPSPVITGGKGLWEVLQRRRSVRAYSEDSVSLGQVSQLLWAMQGITGAIGDFKLRTAPSAGALYPIETYLCVNRVSDLGRGVYHYSVQGHALELLKEGDYSQSVMRSALDQQLAKKAALVVMWSAVFERSTWKYLERAYRYIFLDAGHIAQNLALASEALGLGSCQIGAIYDDEMNALLDLDGITESVIYLSAVGHTRRTRE